MTPPDEVLDRFGDRSRQIRRLFGIDETFREVCENYAECARALGHWSRAHGEDRRRVEDYRTMLEELEGEIDGYLKVSD